MREWLIKLLGGTTEKQMESVFEMMAEAHNNLDTLWADEYLVYEGKEFIALPKRGKDGKFCK